MRRSAGQIRLPSKAYMVEILLPDDLKVLEAVHQAEKAALLQLEKSDKVRDPFGKISIDILTAADRNADPLLQSGSIGMWFSDPLDEGNKKGLEAIQYYIPDVSKELNEPTGAVLVFEGESPSLDSDHCDISATLSCTTYQLLEEGKFSGQGHATQVFGLLAARRNKWGISGLAPSATIRFYQDNPSFPAPFFEAQKDLISAGLNAPAFVVNFSADWRASDRYRNLLNETAGSQFLIVAAAGNDYHDVRSFGACRARPGCLSADIQDDGRPTVKNVISVVALAATETKVLDATDCPGIVGSNYGPWFDVAAPGSFLVPAMSIDNDTHDGLATFCGTSAATPVVSALATLLIRKASVERLTPTAPWIRDRILATVDFLPELEDAVRFGRVNYSRALSKIDQDTLSSCGCPPPCDQPPSSSWAINRRNAKNLRLGEGAEAIQTPLSKIRRFKPGRTELRRYRGQIYQVSCGDPKGRGYHEGRGLYKGRRQTRRKISN